MEEDHIMVHNFTGSDIHFANGLLMPPEDNVRVRPQYNRLWFGDVRIVAPPLGACRLSFGMLRPEAGTERLYAVLRQAVDDAIGLGGGSRHLFIIPYVSLFFLRPILTQITADYGGRVLWGTIHNKLDRSGGPKVAYFKASVFIDGSLPTEPTLKNLRAIPPAQVVVYNRTHHEFALNGFNIPFQRAWDVNWVTEAEEETMLMGEKFKISYVRRQLTPETHEEMREILQHARINRNLFHIVFASFVVADKVFEDYLPTLAGMENMAVALVPPRRPEWRGAVKVAVPVVADVTSSPGSGAGDVPLQGPEFIP